jgi:hypothetical protein
MSDLPSVDPSPIHLPPAAVRPTPATPGIAEAIDHAHALHRQLLDTRRAHHSAEHRLAGLLVQLADGRHHVALGYATVHRYAQVALDLTVRQTRALLAIGRRLVDLPVLDAAFAEGRLGWTKARELLRVVDADNESEWVERAMARTSRELEREVSACAVGDMPPEPSDPKGPARQRLVFEIDAADAELVIRAIALLRTQTDLDKDEVEDGALLAAMAHRVVYDLEAAQTPTAEPHRVVVEHCPSCRRTEGLDAELRDTLIDQAACDHDHVDMRPGVDRGSVGRAIPTRTRRAVLHRDRLRCALPGCECRLWLHLHHLRPWVDGGDHDEANLLTVCSVHHRAIHDGLLAVFRDPAGRVVVQHADGREVSAMAPPAMSGSAGRDERPTWVT